jgi:hypothetical protein
MEPTYISQEQLKDMFENSLILQVEQTTTPKRILRSSASGASASGASASGASASGASASGASASGASASSSLSLTPMKRSADEAYLEDPVTPVNKTTEGGPASFLSPYTEDLIASVSPISQYKLIRDILTDEERLRAQGIHEEDTDADFKVYNSSIIGTDLELWVCAHLLCPICKVGRLYKYASGNMPVIDAVCSNEHPNHSRYFQIKTTMSETKNIYGFYYFNFKQNYISTGSKRYGYNAHYINASDPINNKKLLVNYICIEYNINNNKININTSKSFCVFPILELRSDKPYYEYMKNIYNKSIVIPSLELCERITFKDLYDDIEQFKSIELNYYFDTRKVYNKIPHKLLFPSKIKYLLMKKKYIDLKKKLNLI